MLIPVIILIRLSPGLGLLPNSSSLSDNDLSTFLLLLPLFEWSSFSSINDINLRTRPEIELRETAETDSEGAVRHNCCIICKKYMKSATKQAIPQIRKRPQKLLSWSLSDSISVFSKVQVLRISHLSRIRWRSPFSDSCRIAVDMSTAKGESRGNAYHVKDNKKGGEEKRKRIKGHLQYAKV